MSTVRVMLSDTTRLDPMLRVEGSLGAGFRALPVFEQERRVDELLAAAREKVLAVVVYHEPEAVRA